MNIFSSGFAWLPHGGMTVVEYTAIAFYALTALLVVFTYCVSRQDWAEIGAWAALASIAVAIHFMLVGWREISLPVHRAMPAHVQDIGLRIKDCAECPELVVVQSGYFIMGADDADAGPEEGPLRRMMIARRFAISRAAISPVEWAAYVRATGAASRRCGAPGACLTWQDARAYVRWLSGRAGKSYRLPSSSEWEYAARAGAPAPASNGGIRSISYSPQSTTTGDAAPGQNAFGLNGLLPGVEEFVEDCWSPTIGALASDGAPLTPPPGMTCRARVTKIVSVVDRPRFSGRRPVAPERSIPFATFRVMRELTGVSN